MPGGKVLKIYSYENGVVREDLPLQIRQARPTEARRILDITHEAYALRPLVDPPYKALLETTEDVERHLTVGGVLAAVWTDMEGEQVVGAIRYRVSAPGVLLGYRLAVKPSHQRRGIARRLLVRLEREARLEECDTIHLHVRHDAPELVGMYLKMGYSVAEEQDPRVPEMPGHFVLAKSV